MSKALSPRPVCSTTIGTSPNARRAEVEICLLCVPLRVEPRKEAKGRRLERWNMMQTVHKGRKEEKQVSRKGTWESKERKGKAVCTGEETWGKGMEFVSIFPQQPVLPSLSLSVASFCPFSKSLMRMSEKLRDRLNMATKGMKEEEHRRNFFRYFSIPFGWVFAWSRMKAKYIVFKNGIWVQSYLHPLLLLIN